MAPVRVDRTAVRASRTALMLMLGLAATACNEELRPTGPRGPCWMDVDTLFASGIAVTDTSAVRSAFEAYIAFVDTTAAEFPAEADWSYLASRPYWSWRGRRYWQVDHEAYSQSLDMRLSRRTIYVDENGMVVLPFHCI